MQNKIRHYNKFVAVIDQNKVILKKFSIFQDTAQ